MINTNTLKDIIQTIILHQQAIIGPLAIDQARKVQGLTIQNGSSLTIEIKTTDSASLLTRLVEKYRDLFGQTSVEVCKDAIKESGTSISNLDLPEILQ
jgi:phosphotransferase system HPr-like phosphotransfer protein